MGASSPPPPPVVLSFQRPRRRRRKLFVQTPTLPHPAPSPVMPSCSQEHCGRVGGFYEAGGLVVWRSAGLPPGLALSPTFPPSLPTANGISITDSNLSEPFAHPPDHLPNRKRHSA